jgi:hypothetical protein
VKAPSMATVAPCPGAVSIGGAIAAGKAGTSKGCKAPSQGLCKAADRCAICSVCSINVAPGPLDWLHFPRIVGRHFAEIRYKLLYCTL